MWLVQFFYFKVLTASKGLINLLIFSVFQIFFGFLIFSLFCYLTNFPFHYIYSCQLIRSTIFCCSYNFFFLKLFNAQTIFQLIFLTEVTLHVEKPCRVVICRTQKVFGHLFSSTHDSVETTAICETKTKLCSEIVSISFFTGTRFHSFLHNESRSRWISILFPQTSTVNEYRKPSNFSLEF